MPILCFLESARERFQDGVLQDQNDILAMGPMNPPWKVSLLTKVILYLSKFSLT